MLSASPMGRLNTQYAQKSEGHCSSRQGSRNRSTEVFRKGFRRKGRQGIPLIDASTRSLLVRAGNAKLHPDVVITTYRPRCRVYNPARVRTADHAGC